MDRKEYYEYTKNYDYTHLPSPVLRVGITLSPTRSLCKREYTRHRHVHYLHPHSSLGGGNATENPSSPSRPGRFRSSSPKMPSLFQECRIPSGTRSRSAHVHSAQKLLGSAEASLHWQVETGAREKPRAPFHIFLIRPK